MVKLVDAHAAALTDLFLLVDCLHVLREVALLNESFAAEHAFVILKDVWSCQNRWPAFQAATCITKHAKTPVPT